MINAVEFDLMWQWWELIHLFFGPEKGLVWDVDDPGKSKLQLAEYSFSIFGEKLSLTCIRIGAYIIYSV